MTTTDKIRLVLAFILLMAGVAGYYSFAGLAPVVRILIVLAGVGAAAAVAWTSQPGKQFYAFSRESAAETRRVVWPTRKETLQTTGVVFLLVVVVALFLWVVDASLMWLVQLLMGQGA
jgi:preprotein translocase subunit SecE